MNDLVQTILEPQTETERRDALLQLWRQVRSEGAALPEELGAFLRQHRTKDWDQSVLIGLLLWKSEEAEIPAPPRLLVRVFPGLFLDHDPDVREPVAELFAGTSASEFFEQTSDRSLFDLEEDEEEQWYGMRILGNFTAQLCADCDRRRADA